MKSIYVIDAYCRPIGRPVECKVLTKPGSKYLRIDASKFFPGNEDHAEAYFLPTLGSEVRPKNKAQDWPRMSLFAYASMNEWNDRAERRRRAELIFEAMRQVFSGDRAVSLQQLRQACAHLGITYSAD